MSAPLRAAVIGLGKVGSRFDEEPGRKTIWSHVGAYLACPEIDLVAGCDPAEEQRAAFRRRCPRIPVYDDAAKMLRVVEPNLISICTPNETHAETMESVLDQASVKVIWCEKPLSPDLTEAERMVSLCAARNVKLVVSYGRRWVPIWRDVKEKIESGALGRLLVVRVAMPNRLWSIGSHGIDLALWFGGPVTEVRALTVAMLEESNEPAAPALIGFENGAYGIFEVTGRRAELIVEVEIIGSEGRLSVREDRGEIAVENFEPSAVYAGYRQLGAARMSRAATLADSSPFAGVAEEIGAHFCDPDWAPTCDGAEALAVQRVLHEMAGRVG